MTAEVEELRRAIKDLRQLPAHAEVAALEEIISKYIGPIALPPEELRLHVGARSSASNFLRQGWMSCRKVRSVFGESPSGPLLDWGCGVGRTLRWLLAYPDWRTWYRGTDVDRAAIEWLIENGINAVTVCDDQTVALPYEDNSLRGLFSFSVLTHIHPSLFRQWFAEIARILRPGALAYLTFSGDTVLESTHPGHAPAAAAFRDQGWAWIEYPGNYKSAAYASHDFVERAAAGVLKVHKVSRRDYHAMDALYVEKA